MDTKNSMLEDSTKKLLIYFFVGLCFISLIGIIINKNYESEIQTSTNTSETNSIESNTNTNNINTVNNTNIEEKKIEVKVADFSKMSKEEIKSWCNKNNIKYKFKQDYSSKINKEDFISQSIDANEIIFEGDEIAITYSLGKEPTTEELNALAKAESYSSLMYMSKAKIYDQLTSNYGEGFDKEAAQYAIDNIEADWNYNALQKAKSYQSTMNMSKKRIYEQLTSEYGEQFTKSQAQYAIDHLED